MKWKWNKKEKDHRIEFEIKNFIFEDFSLDNLLEYVHKTILNEIVPKQGYSLGFSGCSPPFDDVEDVMFMFSCKQLGLGHAAYDDGFFYYPHDAKSKMYGSIKWKYKYDNDIIDIGLSNILNSKLMCI